VVVIRSPSPRRFERSSPGMREDRGERRNRFGGSRLDSRFDGFESGGKGKGKSKEQMSTWGNGGAASLEPAWQVHARRRWRVRRAILDAAQARGVAHDDGELSGGNGDTSRWWSRPSPPSKGKGSGGKGSARGSTGGYQVSSTRVHVSNLPKDITEGNLEHLFGQHGDVLGLQLLTAGGRSSGPGQICAIVRFSSNEDAEASITALHNKHEVRPGDGPIIVKLAKPNPRWDSPQP